MLQIPSVWARQDPALVAAGIEGEYVVARTRLFAASLLLISPTYNILAHPGNLMHLAGFGLTLVAASVAALLWGWMRRGAWRPWLGFASSIFDISMVTLGLISFYITASPQVALNSSVTFEMYFLVLASTSLRYDARICIVVGLLAIAQYGGLWAWSAAHHELHDPLYVADAGPYLPVDNWTRLLLLAIATLLAVVVVRRAQRLLYLSAHDRLTGLYNRGHFDRALSTAFLQALRSRMPLALVMIDIDHFKRINDEHGHLIGDLVLKAVGERLRQVMRRTDFIARYGGEEFVILMPYTTRDAALVRAEALRQEFAAQPVVLGKGRSLTLSFSAGVAGLPDDSVDTPKELLDAADRRLFAAKRSGRARCMGGA